MPLSLNDKKAVVAEVAEIAANSTALVAADYRGLTVSEMTDLRAKARDAGVHLRVVRNTLARRALEGTSFDCINQALLGPLFLAFSGEEPSSAARLLKDFSKEHDKLEIKALTVDGKYLEAKDLDVLAKLPTRDEALSQLLSVMKAPIEKFVRTLNEPHSKFVRTLAAVRDQKQEG